MLVVFAKGCQMFEPLVDIFDQPAFVVVHVHARGDVHGRDEHHSFFDAAFANDFLYLRCNVHVSAMRLGMEFEIFSKSLHLVKWFGELIWATAAPRLPFQQQSDQQSAPGRDTSHGLCRWWDRPSESLRAPPVRASRSSTAPENQWPGPPPWPQSQGRCAYSRRPAST